MKARLYCKGRELNPTPPDGNARFFGELDPAPVYFLQLVGKRIHNDFKIQFKRFGQRV